MGFLQSNYIETKDICPKFGGEISWWNHVKSIEQATKSPPLKQILKFCMVWPLLILLHSFPSTSSTQISDQKSTQTCALSHDIRDINQHDILGRGFNPFHHDILNSKGTHCGSEKHSSYVKKNTEILWFYIRLVKVPGCPVQGWFSCHTILRVGKNPL